MSKSSIPRYKRSFAGALTGRLREKRRHLQVIFGARQVGKTTLVHQALNELAVPLSVYYQ